MTSTYVARRHRAVLQEKLPQSRRVGVEDRCRRTAHDGSKMLRWERSRFDVGPMPSGCAWSSLSFWRSSWPCSRFRAGPVHDRPACGSSRNECPRGHPMRAALGRTTESVRATGIAKGSSSRCMQAPSAAAKLHEAGSGVLTAWAALRLFNASSCSMLCCRLTMRADGICMQS